VPETHPLLAVQDLALHRDNGAPVLRGLSFTLARGEIFGVVGESGSGKSQLLLSLLGLSMRDAQLSGSARFDGVELVGASASALRGIRGNRIAMLFQDPMRALNPHLTLDRQLTEGLRHHRAVSGPVARQRAREALRAVELSEPDALLQRYPHELSGGMAQRVMLAMALLTEPDLLLADEPTTALDATTQVRVLDLLLALRQRLGMAVLIVTHDLGVVARVADRVAVMYQGEMVEQGAVTTLFSHPAHAYTATLLAAARRLELP
jgi:ABC-type glutathione transport system ATPase component